MHDAQEIVYEITAVVDEQLSTAYERYMADEHIPDLLATACFSRADIARSSIGRYRIRYHADRPGELDRYLDEHAERLRSEMIRHFPAGVSVEREVWQVLKVFGRSDRG